MDFYVIAYIVLFVMIAAFAIMAYKRLNKQPDATPEQKEAVSPDNKEGAARGTLSAEEEYSTSNSALSYLRSGRKRQRIHFIRFKSPYYGIREFAIYYPRIFSGRKFRDIKGIVIENKFVLLREIFLNQMLPGDAREIAKQFEGHLPTEEQIKKIFEYREEISQMLLKIGEEKLAPRGYLYTCGDEIKDVILNYCLNFATGDTYSEDCDENVSAFLVLEL